MPEELPFEEPIYGHSTGVVALLTATVTVICITGRTTLETQVFSRSEHDHDVSQSYSSEQIRFRWEERLNVY